MESYGKYKKILFSVLIVNILLVSTHEGEFWPFSIFPMFSQAGNPWDRALVQRIENPQESNLWETTNREDIRHRVVALSDYGIDTIDYSNFVSKTTEWNARRIQALRDLLDIKTVNNEYWMVTKVSGYLTEADSVIVQTTPLFLLSADTTLANPKL